MHKHSMKQISKAGLMIATLTAVAGSGALAHSDKIPIGDGNISTSPKKNNVMSCQTRFNANAPGAHNTGDWIKGNYWYPDLKPVVDGNVKWSGGGVKISIKGDTRKITTKSVPTHTTGVYPVSRTDDAYQYDRNPNRIKKKTVSINLPANPEIATSASCVPMGMIGVAITGVAIYNALDGPGRDAVAHEIQDACNGHPQRSGQYHYHGPSECMTEIGKASNGHSGLVGYALDGFGIYGSNGAGGKHLSNANLDTCHGHVEKVVWDGELRKIYHYHLTDEYPYTLGCFKGTAVSNGMQQAGGLQNANTGGFQRQGQPPQRPQGGGNDPLSIAAAELGIPVETLRAAVGSPPPNFREAAKKLGISEQKLRRVMRKARRQAGG
jgi:hypothetical protein